MENANIVVKGNTMTISIDLTQDLGLSSSGKSTMVATTRGFTNFATEAGAIGVSLNVTRR